VVSVRSARRNSVSMTRAVRRGGSAAKSSSNPRMSSARSFCREFYERTQRLVHPAVGMAEGRPNSSVNGRARGVTGLDEDIGAGRRWAGQALGSAGGRRTPQVIP
jgi:hypothetical protein